MKKILRKAAIMHALCYTFFDRMLEEWQPIILFYRLMSRLSRENWTLTMLCWLFFFFFFYSAEFF